MADLNVLIACEFSGIVRRAFHKKGIRAVSCDLLPAEDGEDVFHYMCDVEELLHHDWDLVIAHPPCTYLANSGVRWLHERKERWEKMKKGAEFFNKFMNLDSAKHVAIENPIMHKYAVAIIGRRQDQVVQPWQFGHPETKGICLWLKELPKLKPTKICKERAPRVHREPPSQDRWKRRSRFFEGVADAMADQWIAHITQHPNPNNDGNN